jgi:hypothetical protein
VQSAAGAARPGPTASGQRGVAQHNDQRRTGQIGRHPGPGAQRQRTRRSGRRRLGRPAGSGLRAADRCQRPLLRQNAAELPGADPTPSTWRSARNSARWPTATTSPRCWPACVRATASRPTRLCWPRFTPAPADRHPGIGAKPSKWPSAASSSSAMPGAAATTRAASRCGSPGSGSSSRAPASAAMSAPAAESHTCRPCS